MNQRKRRYKEGDYGHSRWPREKPVWQVAVAVEPAEPDSSDTTQSLRIWFHTPHPLPVTAVFDSLKGSLFKSYAIAEDIHPCIINGKCYRSWIVTIHNPDLHRLSLTEWMPTIKSIMERRIRVQVTCFDSFEKFLNT